MRSKDLIKSFLEKDNATELVETLDDLKGSYAVEHVLNVLLSKDNKHTLQSVLELLKEGRS